MTRTKINPKMAKKMKEKFAQSDIHSTELLVYRGSLKCYIMGDESAVLYIIKNGSVYGGYDERAYYYDEIEFAKVGCAGYIRGFVEELEEELEGTNKYADIDPECSISSEIEQQLIETVNIANQEFHDDGWTTIER